MATINLPANLSQISLEKFDGLRSRGELFYRESLPEYVEDGGFKFEFRLSPILQKKPILAPNDPGRKSASNNPFANPDPDFVICSVGTSYLLQLNKYCMQRPSLILHPKEFKEQIEDLDMMDLEGAWGVLQRLEEEGDNGEEWMIMYNCGVEAGSSQGHKHLQLIPRSKGFDLFPDGVELPSDEPICIPGIAFINWVIEIPINATPYDIYQRYKKALEKTRRSQEEAGTCPAYSLVMVRGWIVLIPRRFKSLDGIGANSAGMVGMVWVCDGEEREGWSRLGMLDHLTRLGIPVGMEK